MASFESLSSEINLATRKQHLVLNRLIAARLPLALPPHATNPALLGQGLLPFAQIFVAFERAWDNIPPPSKTNPHLRPDLHHFLSTLRPSGLSRSQRFHSDLSQISKQTSRNLAKPLDNAPPFVSVPYLHEKPHLFLAYAWVFYMAIFSGGRWIRSQLSNVPASFWTEQSAFPDERSQLQPPMSFLSFPPSTQDGELVKSAFKARLETGEQLLTLSERQEIVAEAGRIFEECIDIVKMLDKEIWWETLFTNTTGSHGMVLGGATIMILVVVMIFYYGLAMVSGYA